MIDPAISLALSVYSNRGIYALLIGSGASRSSGIPTGWEITMNLVEKVARLHGESCEGNPIAWYMSKYGKEPKYSELLGELTSTQADRQQLLRAYFEPTEDELSRGLKSPAVAHKAIARLVREGFVKVIVTTNFDRLIEKALEQEGITPSVISTLDQIKGAVPIQHSQVTVIKVNGDYLDTRIRNTEEELERYEEEFEEYLDTIFDEYGLIVTGWSADWDVGLVRALERSKNRRFPIYWTTIGPLGDKAKRIVNQKAAVVIGTRDADSFYDQLNVKIDALRSINTEHPISSRLAVASVKNHLSAPSGIIRLHDLVFEECERLFVRINSPKYKPDSPGDFKNEIRNRLLSYRDASEVMLSIVSTGCYWGRLETDKIWTDVLRRICSTESQSGSTALLNLKRYPGLLTLYSACIAAIAGGNLATVSHILARTKIRNHSTGRDEPIFSCVYTAGVIEDEIVKSSCDEFKNRTYAASCLLRRELRSVFSGLVPDESLYDQHFDFLEYLIGVLLMEQNGGAWAPQGGFLIRGRHSHEENRVWYRFEEQMLTHGAKWELLSGGLFGGSIDRLNDAKTKYDVFLKNIPRI